MSVSTSSMRPSTSLKIPLRFESARSKRLRRVRGGPGDPWPDDGAVFTGVFLQSNVPVGERETRVFLMTEADSLGGQGDARHLGGFPSRGCVLPAISDLRFLNQGPIQRLGTLAIPCILSGLITRRGKRKETGRVANIPWRGDTRNQDPNGRHPKSNPWPVFPCASPAVGLL
jgi:hypothetical protein